MVASIALRLRRAMLAAFALAAGLTSTTGLLGAETGRPGNVVSDEAQLRVRKSDVIASIHTSGSAKVQRRKGDGSQKGPRRLLRGNR